MLKQMWLDLTTGWGGARDWGLGLAFMCILLVFSTLVFVVPVVLVSWIFGLPSGPLFWAWMVTVGVGVWAYDAYERSR